MRQRDGRGKTREMTGREGRFTQMDRRLVEKERGTGGQEEMVIIEELEIWGRRVGVQ